MTTMVIEPIYSDNRSEDGAYEAHASAIQTQTLITLQRIVPLLKVPAAVHA